MASLHSLASLFAPFVLKGENLKEIENVVYPIMQIFLNLPEFSLYSFVTIYIVLHYLHRS